MKELATVVKTSGKIAFVQIEKKPECDSCKVCAFRNGASRIKVRVLNTAGAKTGDTVLVKAEKDNRLLASFVVYVIPVLLAGAGVLIGALCFEKELWAALLCLAGLVLGFAAVYLCDKVLSKSRGFGMEVVEILDTDREKTDGAADTAGARAKNKEEEQTDGTNL